MYRTTERITVHVEATKLVPEYVYWEGERYPVKIFTKCDPKRQKIHVSDGIKFWCAVGGRHVGLVYDYIEKTWILEVAI